MISVVTCKYIYVLEIFWDQIYVQNVFENMIIQSKATAMFCAP